MEENPKLQSNEGRELHMCRNGILRTGTKIERQRKEFNGEFIHYYRIINTEGEYKEWEDIFQMLWNL